MLQVYLVDDNEEFCWLKVPTIHTAKEPSRHYPYYLDRLIERMRVRREADKWYNALLACKGE